jgi:malonate transporter MadL subunit
MAIYGVALLACCTLAGAVLGRLLGLAIGVDADVGGVGIAMLLLLAVTATGQARFRLTPVSANGISFFAAMYIPIVVAMAASQNVLGALSGGWMAIAAGLAAVIASVLLVPVLNRLAR